MAWPKYAARALGVAFALGLIFLPAAQAQTNSAAGIQVSPVVEDMSDATLGGKISRTLEITNLVNQTLTLYPRVMDFHSLDDTGRPTFFDKEERYSRYSLSTWVSFAVESITLEPRQKSTVAYSITVPSDATPGGHYGAVLFTTEKPKLEPDEDNAKVGVVGMIGTLILVRTPGNVSEQLIFEEFKAPSLLFKGPANFMTKFKNTGTIHLKPKGSITLTNTFGKRTTALPINENNGAILPESSRKFEQNWSFDWKAFGKYTATATVTYGSNPKSLTEVRSFIVLPYWLIAAVAVLILTMIAWHIQRRRKRNASVKTVTPPTPKPPRYAMR